YLDRPSRSTRLEGERDAKLDAMASAPARSASLTDQLLAQWSLVEVDETLRAPGVLIITFLEDDGYLRTPLETIIERAPEPPSVEVLHTALRAVQLFLEPAGIAARDARECLLLQIDATEEADDGLRIARVLVEDHLDDILQNRLPRVAERSQMSIDEVKHGLQALRRLSLAPARQLINESEPPITPDAIIEYDEEDDRYIAYLNDTRLPNLRINREYAKLAKEKETPRKDKDFLRTNLSNAQWLIDAVQQRRQTLLRVINVVVDAQREYFDFGPEALKPLPMTQVADQLGIHVATVSRAVAEKYLETPRGIVPLRSFFTGGLQTESGEDVSYDAVRAALKETIDNEDKSKPFSDEALVKELKKKGIEIARRTVAKYRGQMDIQSARLRRQF
ncbi:MAG: RNA polymerase factor sigma-54, partial [Phycisphaerales bacterium]|nr:RNA polymerase factor sigma-54 [Phycisphaerales bacterium]